MTLFNDFKVSTIFFFIYSDFIQFLTSDCFKSSYFKKIIHGLNKLFLVIEVDIIKISKIVNKQMTL